MESSLQLEPTTPATDLADNVHPGVTLLTTLYNEKDLLLFRPVETWTEGDRKRSRVVYSHVRYRHANRDGLQRFISHFDFESQKEFTNQFFGVCPRVADQGSFDLAWQIRTVPCLWADIDNCDVSVALARAASAALPYPTAVVNSGNGVHLYWRLEQPFVIDDAGPSIPVHIEPIQSGESRKKARRYVLEGKDRVYLDQRHHLTKLSPNALQIQDILAGIAEAVGGDHTTDLTRLLRVPGTYNRKDQRNGRHCQSCDRVMTHSFSCKGNKRYRYYVCGTAMQRGWSECPAPSVPAGEIERFVVEQVRTLGKDPTLLKQTSIDVHQWNQVECKRLKDEQKSLERQMRDDHSKLQAIVANPNIASNLSGLSEIQSRLEAADRRAQQINSELGALEAKKIDDQQITNVLTGFDDLWQSLPPKEQVRLVRLLIERVNFDGPGGNVATTFHPTGLQSLTETNLEHAQ